MSPRAALLCAALAASVASRAAEGPKSPREDGKGESTVSEDFVIRGKRAGGPAIWIPQPRLEKGITTEVIESLDVYRADHRPGVPKVRVPAEVRRLRRPFPAPPLLSFDPDTFARPFREWVFEILDASDDRSIWRVEGSRVFEPLTWDGRDSEGRMAAHVGGRYYFQFTGMKGEDGSTMVSEPVEITSLNYQENLGATRMEVANSLVFGEESPKLLRGAAEYLELMAAALARAHPKGKDNRYDLVLCQKDPEGKLAKSRARTLRAYFSSYLVVTPEKISVTLQPVGDRGDITACILPPGKGQSIPAE